MKIAFLMSTAVAALLLTAILLRPQQAQACASCGCTLSSDWETSTQMGWRFELRYDAIDQNQLRSGNSAISSGEASQKVNDGNPQEVEKETINEDVTATIGYAFSADWKLELQVPYIHREHSTLGTASDGTFGGDKGGQYDSRTSNLGDLRLVANDQGFSPDHHWGIQFGLKLPTGQTHLTGNSTDPTSTDAVPIDRGLQPGTGTTDLIFGVYALKSLNQDWDSYVQALYQSALNSSDQYRPGDGANLNVGFRYMSFLSFIPQVQLNGRWVKTDSGLNADTISTGGTLLYLSPGISIPLSEQVLVYSFVQVPLYQNVQGVQLTPAYTASIGTRFLF